MVINLGVGTIWSGYVYKRQVPYGLDGEDDRRTSGKTGAGKEIFRNIVMEIKKRENAV